MQQAQRKRNENEAAGPEKKCIEMKFGEKENKSKKKSARKPEAQFPTEGTQPSDLRLHTTKDTHSTAGRPLSFDI